MEAVTAGRIQTDDEKLDAFEYEADTLRAIDAAFVDGTSLPSATPRAAELAQKSLKEAEKRRAEVYEEMTQAVEKCSRSLDVAFKEHKEKTEKVISGLGGKIADVFKAVTNEIDRKGGVAPAKQTKISAKILKVASVNADEDRATMKPAPSKDNKVKEGKSGDDPNGKDEEGKDSEKTKKKNEGKENKKKGKNEKEEEKKKGERGGRKGGRESRKRRGGRGKGGREGRGERGRRRREEREKGKGGKKKEGGRRTKTADGNGPTGAR